MKKIICMILGIVLTSCSVIYSKSSRLQLENISKEWQIVKFTNNDVIMENSNLLVHVKLTNIIYKNGLNKQSCEARLKSQINIIYPIYITFMPLKDNTDIKGYFFNPSKVSFMKKGKILQCTAIDIFKIKADVPDKYYNFTQEIQKDGYVTLAFNSPILCGQLENTELFIEGLAISKGDKQKPTPLAPIRLRFNFDNPQSIPLYEK